MAKWQPKHIEYILEENTECRDFLRAAYIYGFQNSKDKSTKNGAVLVKDGKIISYGTCGLPVWIGIKDEPERYERPLKYSFAAHAERDAIFNAAKKGVKIEGAVLYVPWYSCSDCAIAIASSGIEAVIGHEAPYLQTPERWQDPIDIGMQILHEAGVKTMIYKGKIGGTKSILNGEPFEP